MNATKYRLLLFSLLIVVADLMTKAWIARAILPYSVRTVVPGLVNLTHVQNRGVAFGLLNSLGDMGPPILIAAGGLALVVVVIYFRQTPGEDLMLLWSLASILGGAVGNLIDRILHGSVTDFIDVYVGTYHWHTFNVADSAISVGICLMLLDLLRQRRSQRAAA
jgi:signal peptidase II